MKTASVPGRRAAPILMLAAEIWLACGFSVVLTTPAAAQFWDFQYWGRRSAPQQRQQWAPWGGWQQPGPEQRVQQPVDASKAPPPRKQEGTPAKTVVVLGDSMADWLGFGLEETFAETPEMGVVRKNRGNSGLRNAAPSNSSAGDSDNPVNRIADLNPNDKSADARFKELQRAYEVLSDTNKRARYDRFGHAGVSGAAGSPADFGFGGFGAGGFTDIVDGPLDFDEPGYWGSSALWRTGEFDPVHRWVTRASKPA